MSQFTKKAIVESFVKLLNKTSLDKITVKDIVEDCGVNRNTFYYYFRDIYALLDELFQAETRKVLEGSRDFRSWQEGFLESTAFALQNKRAIYHIYNSINREQLERYLYDVTDNLMVGIVKNQAEGLKVPEEDIRLLADFYKYALVGMLLEWVRRGMKEDPEVVIKKLGRMMEGNIRYTLMKSGAQDSDKSL